MTEHQTSYKNLDGVYVTGKYGEAIAAYCTDIFNVLNTMRQRQSDLSDVISTLPNFTGETRKQKSDGISKTLAEDSGLIKNLDIAKTPETAPLEDMKTKVSDLLSENTDNYVASLSDNTFVLMEDTLHILEQSLQEVSGANIKNFNVKYKDSDDFKVRMLDAINAVQEALDKIPVNGNNAKKKIPLANSIKDMKRKALEVYNFVADTENLRKKMDASGTNMEDLLKQVFPGAASRN